MKFLPAILRDQDRPVIVTVIAGITAVSAVLKILGHLSIAAEHPRLISVPYVGMSLLILALACFLFTGANWARITFAFLCILSALLAAIAMLNAHVTMYGVIAIAYVLFVFGTLTLNRKVIAYFNRTSKARQRVAGSAPQAARSRNATVGPGDET